MANVTIKFNGKEFLLSCDDGQEEHLEELLIQINKKFNELKNNLGNIGENKLLLITAVKVMDEYHETKKKVEQKKIELRDLSNKFKELKSLVYDYRDKKEDEIESLNEKHHSLKLEIDNNQKKYEKLIDQTADEISNFVEKANLENLSQINLVNKSKIRKKIQKKKISFFSKELKINFNKILTILNKLKIKNKIIGGYYPYNYEVDSLEILKKLEKKNYKISIPKILKNNQMNFYEWSFKDPLTINTFGIPEPTSEKMVYPDILLIPLLAFDNDLHRLGYGGGYYDRYLARVLNNKKITTIGLSYSFQKIKKLPINKYDIKLDYVITEKDIFK